MSKERKKIGFLFPGQGAQYPGMAGDFVSSYSQAREVFEEADEILKRKLSQIILNGPEAELTETKNSQVGIYVASVAILKVLNSIYPDLIPIVTGGLSLGEYTALYAGGKCKFDDCLKVVNLRANFMNEACESSPGTMLALLGIGDDQVERMVKELNLPHDLWVANYNCPGQVVISGTKHGIEKATAEAKTYGAKRAIPLQVHGAFHSGLMAEAQRQLEPYLLELPLVENQVGLAMNVNGKVENAPDAIRQNLIKQVTHPVRWHQCVQSMVDQGVDFFIEIGCGKTLAAFNKKIGIEIPTVSLERVEDLKKIEELC